MTAEILVEYCCEATDRQIHERVWTVEQELSRMSKLYDSAVCLLGDSWITNGRESWCYCQEKELCTSWAAEGAE